MTALNTQPDTNPAASTPLSIDAKRLIAYSQNLSEEDQKVCIRAAEILHDMGRISVGEGTNKVEEMWEILNLFKMLEKDNQKIVLNFVKRLLPGESDPGLPEVEWAKELIAELRRSQADYRMIVDAIYPGRQPNQEMPTQADIDSVTMDCRLATYIIGTLVLKGALYFDVDGSGDEAAMMMTNAIGDTRAAIREAMDWMDLTELEWLKKAHAMK